MKIMVISITDTDSNVIVEDNGVIVDEKYDKIYEWISIPFDDTFSFMNHYNIDKLIVCCGTKIEIYTREDEENGEVTFLFSKRNTCT